MATVIPPTAGAAGRGWGAPGLTSWIHGEPPDALATRLAGKHLGAKGEGAGRREAGQGAVSADESHLVPENPPAACPPHT